MRKLVRGRIPEIIDNNGKGEKSHTRILKDNKEFLSELLKKLLEETREVVSAVTPEARLIECTDVVEVILSLLALQGVTLHQFMQALHARRKERGGFEERVFLESVETQTPRPDRGGYHVFSHGHT
jgi:predicted house-cleaning noncanonical NTP pyrophosphatase (MazG superfamily)